MYHTTTTTTQLRRSAAAAARNVPECAPHTSCCGRIIFFYFAALLSSSILFCSINYKLKRGITILLFIFFESIRPVFNLFMKKRHSLPKICTKVSHNSTKLHKAESGRLWRIISYSICIVGITTLIKYSFMSFGGEITTGSKDELHSFSVDNFEAMNRKINYEEYLDLSLKHGWAPADPVMKLEATISKYCQV